jgi:hypothetical protein
MEWERAVQMVDKDWGKACDRVGYWSLKEGQHNIVSE